MLLVSLLIHLLHLHLLLHYLSNLPLESPLVKGRKEGKIYEVSLQMELRLRNRIKIIHLLIFIAIHPPSKKCTLGWNQRRAYTNTYKHSTLPWMIQYLEVHLMLSHSSAQRFSFSLTLSFIQLYIFPCIKKHHMRCDINISNVFSYEQFVISSL